MNPKVVVGGFPNSGTSVLCNLVAEMGFSPGSKKNLKGADDHNRWGYWEHVLIYNAVTDTGGIRNYHVHRVGTVPNWSPDLSKDIMRKTILEIANRDNVEVYKDNRFPLIYTLFPKDSKFICVTRSAREVYRSGKYYESEKLSYDPFVAALRKYESLVKDYLCKDRECLIVSYNEMRLNFQQEIKKVCKFLDVDCNMERLEWIWRPR